LPLSVFIIADSQAMLAALLGMLASVGNIRVLGTARSREVAAQCVRQHRGQWDLLVFSDAVTGLDKVRCMRSGADAVFGRADIRRFVDYVRKLAGGTTALPR
jgi:hypothetical protein